MIYLVQTYPQNSVAKLTFPKRINGQATVKKTHQDQGRGTWHSALRSPQCGRICSKRMLGLNPALSVWGSVAAGSDFIFPFEIPMLDAFTHSI